MATPQQAPQNCARGDFHRSPEAPRQCSARAIGTLWASLAAGFSFSCALAGAPTEPDLDPKTTALLAITPRSSVAPESLDQGFRDFLLGIAEAGRALEDPAFFPPAPTDRNLAEGYRYLLGHLARIIEAETHRHPDFPHFQQSINMLSKWTIDNPDTMYLSASIHADGVYRIRGRARDHAAWRTHQRNTAGKRAPRVVIFQTTTGGIGQTGELAEMSECRNQTLDSIDQFEIEVDAEGLFEILVAKEKPRDYRGHFLASRAEAPCPTPFGTTTYRLRDATQLNVREIFSEWNHEVPLDLEIVRLDKRGTARPPRTGAEMGLHLSEIGRRLANQVKFWNRLHELGLEVNGDRNGDGRQALPKNDLNPPAPPFIAGGTAGAGQLYAAGTFELESDEALVVRVEAPLEPYYLGFQLGNLWGESLDQANYVSSQTGGQNPVASDGARYYIISHHDPGTPGWMDTTGLPKGTTSMRFIFEDAPENAEVPTLTMLLTKTETVRDHLPPDTPFISPDERIRQVDARQRHIKRRWRQY